ncbi:hypothetical protein KKC83_05350 [Patescibacteria group bacterium]|nr:hypothetical protein [Candidatus Falkowbacteria bacterium]MBU3906335.1 hypothetical protein [Patescibacteria group bacterium]MBU4015218.1 hypothetical protein [Patescibacteria group bacterium]MBU4026943.1 hypothetical protein [Patescibacteria group bacterium]MBU4072519.1 hypothetical protein [Patescibacteria group bacterium]
MDKIKHFDNKEQLVDELKNREICSKNLLIGIDGFLGAGKTYLADDLVEILGTNCVNTIDIDDEEKNYYLQKKRSIIKYTNFDKLKNDIINLQRKTSVIFSSACLLQILKKINISPDIHIYIKKMAKCVGCAPDKWIDEDNCTFEGDINKWGKQGLSERLEPVDTEQLETTRKEVVRYHQKYKPHEKAEFLYKRYEK